MAILDRLKDMLAPGGGPDTDADREHRLRVACAALLVEIQRADHETDPAEEAAVAGQLAERFALDEDETRELVALAAERVDAATSLYEFTSLLHRQLDQADKHDLMAMLWRTAWADGTVQRDEEQLLRRVGELLYLPHSEFVRIKLQVEAEQDRD